MRFLLLFLGSVGLLSIGTLQIANAQIGGRSVFNSLKFSPSARIASMGGANITLCDNDALMAFQNPALLNEKMHSRVSFSFVDYLSDINYGVISYAHHFKKVGTIHAGMQYINYGKFIQADEYGNKTGNFSANDMAFVIGLGRTFGKFHVGANFKLMYSGIASYSSVGAGVDFGGAYVNEKSGTTAGLALKNIGGQFMNYTSGTKRGLMPFEVQVGITQRIPKTPMRLSLTLVNLETPKIIYDNEVLQNEVDLTGQTVKKKSNVGDQIFRHTIWGAEFLITKDIHIRLAYNHARRMELKATNQSVGIGGFSFGAGFRIKMFHLDYGYSHFNNAGGQHQFTVSTFINRFGKNKVAPGNDPIKDTLIKTKAEREERRKAREEAAQKAAETPKAEPTPAPDPNSNPDPNKKDEKPKKPKVRLW